MSLVAVKIIAGTAFDIYALEVRGKNEVLDYMNELERTKRQELGKLTRLLDQTANHGLIKIRSKFKLLRNDIYEFKTTGGIRMACFLDHGSIIVLTNGFKKPKNYDGEIEQAINLRNNYLACKRSESLSYRDETQSKF